MKKLLAILLTLCMALSLAACTPSAAENPTETPTEAPTQPPLVWNGIESDHKHCVCAAKSVNKGAHTSCSNEDGWVAVGTADELKSAIAGAVESPAYIYLTADITVDGEIRVMPGAKVYVCLNGKTMTCFIRNYGNLNVTDCTGNGTWTSAKDWTMRGFSTSVLNLYAGTYTITDASEESQVFTAETGAVEEYELPEADAFINLYGGKIHNPNESSAAGANIWLGGRACVNMYGGEIGACNVVNAGGNDYKVGGSICIRGDKCAFTMYDGVIQGGKLDTGSEDALGGNIGMWSGQLYVYGGTIKDGVSSGYGGNIATANKTGVIHIENATVSGGVAKKFGGNLYFNGGDRDADFTTHAITLKNATISGGMARTGGNIFHQRGVFTMESCKVLNGLCDENDIKHERGGGLAIQGQAKSAVILAGANEFTNNFGSDILFREHSSGAVTPASIAGITGTDEILIASNAFLKVHPITTDNNANAATIFKAIDGCTLVEAEGVWTLSPYTAPAA